MSAKHTFFQSPRSVFALAAIAAVAGFSASVTDASAAEKSRTLKSFYFSNVCSSDSCIKTVKTIGANKKFEIKDVACRLYVSNGGEAVVTALRIYGTGQVAALNDFETSYNGTRNGSEYYVAGRNVDIVAGPSSEIRIETWATQDFNNVLCTLSGDWVKLN